MHYIFCQVHQSLRVTPAMGVGLAKSVWELSQIVALLEAKENSVVGTVANKCGPYQEKAKDSECPTTEP